MLKITMSLAFILSFVLSTALYLKEEDEVIFLMSASVSYVLFFGLFFNAQIELSEKTSNRNEKDDFSKNKNNKLQNKKN